MKRFSDSAGRNWVITINIDAIKRIKAALGIDLLEAVEGKLIQRLMEDPVLLCDVVYCLCKDQADSAGVSDEAFGRAMGGDAIDLATAAMLEELVDFFPSRRRGLLGKAVEKFRLLETTAITAATARLDSPELQERIDAAIEQAASQMVLPPTPGEPSTPPPASQA